MLRYMYRFTLPGRRRVVIAYFPPEPEETRATAPSAPPSPVYHDRVFVQAGLYSGGLNPMWLTHKNKQEGPVPRGKRIR